jgi:AGZA family xanthine/uracil permease-like MFS transporter
MHGQQIGVAVSPIVAISYLAVAGMLFSCAKFAVVEPVPVEQAAPVASEASPA